MREDRKDSRGHLAASSQRVGAAGWSGQGRSQQEAGAVRPAAEGAGAPRQGEEAALGGAASCTPPAEPESPRGFRGGRYSCSAEEVQHIQQQHGVSEDSQHERRDRPAPTESADDGDKTRENRHDRGDDSDPGDDGTSNEGS